MRTLAVFVGLVLLTAGCLSGAEDQSRPSSDPGAPSGSGPGHEGDPDAGRIRVLVTTTEMMPVEGAQVTADPGGHAAFTGDDGQVLFSGLAAGKYTVLAAKPGFRTVEDRGRLVEVMPGEESETKLTLAEIPVLDESSGYQKTSTYPGHLACAYEGNLGYTNYCGRGVSPNGVNVGNPNDKSLFKLSLEGPTMQAIVLEGKWNPATAATGTQLRMLVAPSLSCTAVGCHTANAEINVGGPPPLYGIKIQGDNLNLTRRWGVDPQSYPKEAYVEARAHCGTGCVGAGVAFEQPYTMYVTVFYGKQPDPAWRYVPS